MFLSFLCASGCLGGRDVTLPHSIPLDLVRVRALTNVGVYRGCCGAGLPFRNKVPIPPHAVMLSVVAHG